MKRREFLTGFASVAALSTLSPMHTLASLSVAELGRKAQRGNEEFIREKGIGVKKEVVEVRGEKFSILLFEKDGPSKQKFFVPHDNEVAAFDSALRFVGEHGGTLVTLDSGGERNLKTQTGKSTGQDPNRMFAETSSHWPLAQHILQVIQEKGAPVITLHNNAPIGSFILSITKPSKGLTLYTVNKQKQRDVVWMSRKEHTVPDDTKKIISSLNASGVNCVYEVFDGTKSTDGSLSQYCAKIGVPYFNIEIGLQGPSEAHVLDARDRQTSTLHALLQALKR